MIVRSPIVLLYDANGNPLAVQDGVAIPVNTSALLLAGKEPGGTAKYLRMAVDGTVRTDPTGTTTQPVSASSLPLPSGAATEATLATRAAAAQLPNTLTMSGNLSTAVTEPLPTGSNIVGQIKITNGTTSVGLVTDGFPQLASTDQETVGLLTKILCELKMLNLRMLEATELEISPEDVQ